MTLNMKFVVSPRLRDEYENGRVYYALQDKEIMLFPIKQVDQPSREFLAWHNENVFQ